MENWETPEMEALEMPIGEEEINPIVDWNPGGGIFQTWVCEKCGRKFWLLSYQGAKDHERDCPGIPSGS